MIDKKYFHRYNTNNNFNQFMQSIGSKHFGTSPFLQNNWIFIWQTIFSTESCLIKIIFCGKQFQIIWQKGVRSFFALRKKPSLGAELHLPKPIWQITFWTRPCLAILQVSSETKVVKNSKFHFLNYASFWDKSLYTLGTFAQSWSSKTIVNTIF